MKILEKLRDKLIEAVAKKLAEMIYPTAVSYTALGRGNHLLIVVPDEETRQQMVREFEASGYNEKTNAKIYILVSNNERKLYIVDL